MSQEFETAQKFREALVEAAGFKKPAPVLGTDIAHYVEAWIKTGDAGIFAYNVMRSSLESGAK